MLELALPALRVPFMRDAIVAVFCVLSAILMGRIARARQVGEDAAIGVALAVAMALGVICIDVRAEWVRRLSAQPGADLTTIGYTPSFHDLLFGNILSISRAEVYLACIVSGAVVLWVALVYKGLVLYAADEEAATVLGLPVGMLHYGLLTSLGVTVVVAMRLLGVILVSGLLILPGIIAGFWARRMRATIAIAIVVSLLSIVIGLGTSMSLHVLSTGPVIVLVLALAFALELDRAGARRLGALAATALLADADVVRDVPGKPEARCLLHAADERLAGILDRAAVRLGDAPAALAHDVMMMPGARLRADPDAHRLARRARRDHQAFLDHAVDVAIDRHAIRGDAARAQRGGDLVGRHVPPALA